MSRPAPGFYYICNSVLAPDGSQLAITFNGGNNIATVTPKDGRPAQIWKVDDYDDTASSISPLFDAQNYQAAWGSDGVVILPSGAYVWAIKEIHGEYTIQDGGETNYWNLTQPESDETIRISTDEVNELGHWVFEAATIDSE